MSISSAVDTIVNGVGTFFKSLGNIWELVKYFFTDYIPDVVSFAIEVVLAVPDYIFAVFVDLITVVVSAIPVPDFVSRAGPALLNVGETVLFFASPFKLGYGITVILSAYIIRFFIRRIPFIG